MLLHESSLIAFVLAPRLAGHVSVFQPSPEALERVDDIVVLSHQFLRAVDVAQAAASRSHEFVSVELSKLLNTCERRTHARNIRADLNDVLARLEEAERRLANLNDGIAQAVESSSMDNREETAALYTQAANACHGRFANELVNEFLFVA